MGKPWQEADADVAEAIDFCRYYGWRGREELAPRHPGQLAGEANSVWWEGRGPTAVIAPWNFPLAILTGMTAAALVAGNPVLMKPAEQSSAVALDLYRHLMAAGVPSEVVHLLPGSGEVAGRALVGHPLVACIAFTGSRDVGLEIMSAAAIRRPGQPQMKEVICEMGGKNAIIIDADADLDEAIAGVLGSAFGYAGQKCSACSRLILVGSAAVPCLDRLIDAMGDLTIVSALDPGCQLPPVIDDAAVERLDRWCRAPGPGAMPLYAGKTTPRGGRFVAPVLFEVTDANHPLMQTELFGPILTVMRVATFEEALVVANGTEYALTGGVYSRLPSHLEQARREFRVGNLYLNRGCTGALVHRQPFGGFGMSGLGTKAGGPGYVRNFCVSRAISENTLRRGFAPGNQVDSA